MSLRSWPSARCGGIEAEGFGPTGRGLSTCALTMPAIVSLSSPASRAAWNASSRFGPWVPPPAPASASWWQVLQRAVKSALPRLTSAPPFLLQPAATRPETATSATAARRRHGMRPMVLALLTGGHPICGRTRLARSIGLRRYARKARRRRAAARPRPEEGSADAGPRGDVEGGPDAGPRAHPARGGAPDDREGRGGGGRHRRGATAPGDRLRARHPQVDWRGRGSRHRARPRSHERHGDLRVARLAPRASRHGDVAPP